MTLRAFVSLLLLPVLLVGTSCAQKKENQKDVIVAVKKPSKQGYLGVQISDLTAAIAKEKKVKAESGALVGSVVEDSPAEKAGIKEEDAIIEFAGKKITDAEDLIKAVQETKPGTKVNVVVMRGNERKTLPAEVGKASKEQSYAFSVVPPLATRPGRLVWTHTYSHSFGLQLMDLNKQLGEYFETPGGRGVLVEEVPKGSAGEKAGFRAGDVIIKIGNESIRRTDDIQYALEELEEGDSVDVTVLRKGKQLTLNVDVEESAANSFGPNFKFDRYRGTPGHLESLFELKVPEEGEILHMDSEAFRSSMKKLREEMQTLQQKLQGELKGLKVRLREQSQPVRI